MRAGTNASQRVPTDFAEQLQEFHRSVIKAWKAHNFLSGWILHIAFTKTTYYLPTRLFQLELKWLAQWQIICSTVLTGLGDSNTGYWEHGWGLPLWPNEKALAITARALVKSEFKPALWLPVAMADFYIIEPQTSWNIISSPDQIFCVHPMTLLKNRVWTLACVL